MPEKVIFVNITVEGSNPTTLDLSLNWNIIKTNYFYQMSRMHPKLAQDDNDQDKILDQVTEIDNLLT